MGAVTTFWVNDECLTDGRFPVLAAVLGVGDGEALVACQRLWCWMQQAEKGVIAQPWEVDAVTKKQGFADAMISAKLAEPTPEGLRIWGAWPGLSIPAYRKLQANKGKLGAAKRWAKGSEMAPAIAAAMAPAIKSAKSGDHDPEFIAAAMAPAIAAAISPHSSSLRSEILDPGSNQRSLDLDLRSKISDLKTTEHASQLPLTPLVGRKQKPLSPKHAAALEAAKSYVEWLNRRLAKRFTVTVELVKQVAAVLERGWSEKPDMRGVSLFLASQWEGDEHMERFLRPSSMLVVSKFAERLDQAKEWDRTLGSKIWPLDQGHE